MKLVKIINGQPKPYTEAAFRADNKHTVYGKVVPARHLNAQGVYRVRTLGKPDVPVGQKAKLDSLPTQTASGEWVLGWSLEALDADEARTLRNELLAETDWTANSDVTMSSEMQTYRQALRNVPAQASFPDNVVWPTKPE